MLIGPEKAMNSNTSCTPQVIMQPTTLLLQNEIYNAAVTEYATINHSKESDIFIPFSYLVAYII